MADMEERIDSVERQLGIFSAVASANSVTHEKIMAGLEKIGADVVEIKVARAKDITEIQKDLQSLIVHSDKRWTELETAIRKQNKDRETHTNSTRADMESRFNVADRKIDMVEGRLGGRISAVEGKIEIIDEKGKIDWMSETKKFLAQGIFGGGFVAILYLVLQYSGK